MTVEFITLIIQAVLTIGSAAYIINALKARIDAQQGQINTMQSTLNTMKSYVEVFDPNKVQEFVKISEESSRKKAEQEAERNWINYFNTQILPRFEEYQNDYSKLQEEKYKEKHEYLEDKIENLKKYNELIGIVSAFAAFIPKEQRNNFIKNMGSL